MQDIKINCLRWDMFLKDQPFSKMAPSFPNPGSATAPDPRLYETSIETATMAYVSVLGVRGRDPQDFGGGCRGGIAGVVAYCYMLSCTASMFESGDFEEK